MRTPAIALLLLFVPTMLIAYDDLFSGNKLKELMDHKDPVVTPQVVHDRGIAQGFVMGVAGVLSTGEYYCPPTGSTQSQAYDVVKKYLEDHPENRYLPAHFLVAEALKQSFPCSVWREGGVK